MAHAAWAKRRRQKHSEVRMFENMLNPEHASYDEELGLRVLGAFLQTEPKTAFRRTPVVCFVPTRLQYSSGNFQALNIRVKPIEQRPY